MGDCVLQLKNDRTWASSPLFVRAEIFSHLWLVRPNFIPCHVVDIIIRLIPEALARGLSLARKPAKFCQPQKFPFSEIAWRKTMCYYHVRRWNIFFTRLSDTSPLPYILLRNLWSGFAYLVNESVRQCRICQPAW
jgi:hypothetical protein